MASFKKVGLMVVGTAMQTFGDALETEQEVLSYAADVLIETYAAESAVIDHVHRGPSITAARVT